MMFRAFSTLIIIVILFFVSTPSKAQIPIGGTWGKGLRMQAKDSSFALKFSFRFQTLYSGSYNPDLETWSESMMIRRSRLKFDGYAVNPKIVYKVELGVSNRDSRPDGFGASGNTANIILDAVVKWKFAPGWQLWFGQTKLPGNRERVVSSQKLQFVDRSLVNSRFTLDRDIGVQLRNKSTIGDFVINQIGAVSMGQGRDIIIANPVSGRQYTGRVELLPFGEFTGGGDYFMSDLAREQTPKLSVGGTYDYNIDAPRSRGNLGGFVTDANNEFITSDLNTILIDAIFKYKGVSVVSEYAHRTSDNKKDSFGYGQGLTMSAGYLFPSNFEIAARVTRLEPISDLSSIQSTQEYMLGVSKYISGHSLKVQSDFSYTELPGFSDFFMFRLQCEVAL